MINDEHPSTVATQSRPRYYPGNEIAWANTYMPMEWYAGGKQRFWDCKTGLQGAGQ